MIGQAIELRAGQAIHGHRAWPTPPVRRRSTSKLLGEIGTQAPAELLIANRSELRCSLVKHATDFKAHMSISRSPFSTARTRPFGGRVAPD